jgi:hypothetical protein
VSIDIHQLGVNIFYAASVLSLLFVIAKPLGREFEKVVLVWIRAFKRIRAEWRLPLKSELTSQPPQLLDHIGSKRE